MYISKRANISGSLVRALDFDEISSVLRGIKGNPVEELFVSNPSELRALFKTVPSIDPVDVKNSFNFYKELVEASKKAGTNLTGLNGGEIKIYNGLIEKIHSAKQSGKLDELETFINENNTEIKVITKKLETNHNALKPAKLKDSDDSTVETERIRKERQKNLADAAKVKYDKTLLNAEIWKNRIETGKNIYLVLKAVIALSAVGAIALYFYSSTKEEKEKLNISIDNIIECLNDINLDEKSSLNNLRSSIINKLTKLKLYSSSSQMLNSEQEADFKNLMIELFSPENSYSIPSFVTLLNNEFLSGRISRLNDEQDFSEAIMCINNSSLEAANIINSILSGASGGRSPGVRPTSGTQKNDLPNRGGSSINGNVTLSTGQSYSIVIDSRKPSIPQRFVLYFANGAGPDNFFSSPEFAAFVDPDEESPTGGSGLVPNAIGVNPIEKRIVSAIKYCYNNDIDSGRELSGFMIRQINSGVGRLKKLFTNEPEQRVLSRSVDYYSGRGSGQRRRIFNRRNRNSGNQGI